MCAFAALAVAVARRWWSLRRQRHAGLPLPLGSRYSSLDTHTQRSLKSPKAKGSSRDLEPLGEPGPLAQSGAKVSLARLIPSRRFCSECFNGALPKPIRIGSKGRQRIPSGCHCHHPGWNGEKLKLAVAYRSLIYNTRLEGHEKRCHPDSQLESNSSTQNDWNRGCIAGISCRSLIEQGRESAEASSLLGYTPPIIRATSLFSGPWSPPPFLRNRSPTSACRWDQREQRIRARYRMRQATKSLCHLRIHIHRS
jgi:hypothetical protein